MKIRLNDDKHHIKKVKEALKDNDGYCPCALVKDADHKCICKDFREQKEGLCHCGLYIKK